MGYIGPAPTTSFQSFVKQDITTSATANYTLSQSVTNANELRVVLNNVIQEPTTAYTASGTSLTMASALTSSDDLYVVYMGKAVGTINAASGSVGVGELSATGTKNSTTFLRGDNTFAVPADNGKILQVQSAFKSDTASTTSTSDVAITGLSLTLTPSATSSKVLVMFDIGTAGNNANAHFFFTPYRDIGGGGYNAIGLGVGATYNYASAHYATSNNNYSAFGGNFLDSPNTTSEITYKLYFRSSSGSYTSYINRRAADDVFRGSSSLTCMEVGA